MRTLAVPPESTIAQFAISGPVFSTNVVSPHCVQMFVSSPAGGSVSKQLRILIPASAAACACSSYSERASPELAM